MSPGTRSDARLREIAALNFDHRREAGSNSCFLHAGCDISMGPNMVILEHDHMAEVHPMCRNVAKPSGRALGNGICDEVLWCQLLEVERKDKERKQRKHTLSSLEWRKASGTMPPTKTAYFSTRPKPGVVFLVAAMTPCQPLSAATMAHLRA